MASDSATAKGKKAVGKRGHPAAANLDNSRGYDPDSNTLDDVTPPSKKRRVASTSGNSSILSPPSASKERRSVGAQVQTPKTPKTRATPRGRNAKPQSPTPPAAQQKSTINSKQAVEDWSNEDLGKLIENLTTVLPKSDLVKYSTQVDRLDWSKICFGDHTADECKNKWALIMTKLRRYRTLTELVTDAKEWIKHPWMSYNNSKGKVGKGKPKPPGLPKKPLTPYFRYFLEKREKHSRENPEMSMTDLAKLLAKKFAELPDKKKMKYKESYEKENESYKAAMEKFRGEHPEMFPDAEGKSRAQGKQNGPLKPQSSVQMFLADKMSKHLNEAGSNRKDIEEKYKNQWKNLSDSKRVRWIKKAMADEERYAAEIAEYRLSHPDYKPENKKSAISKAEKEIKDKFDGKPDRPPNSGYSLYSKIMLKELKDIPSKEKMGEISRRWKELNDKERQAYAKQATESINRYQQEYKLYLANLPEDERKKVDDEDAKRKKRSPGTKGQSNTTAAQKAAAAASATSDHGDNMPSKPKKPMSALFFYQQEKLAQYKTKNPDRSEQELTRQIAREYGELTEKKKEKYKKMAEEAKKVYEQASSSKESELRAKMQKNEPKKPPQSGYSLFTSEMMSKLTDIEPKFRMTEIAKQWSMLNPTEKEKFKKQSADMIKKFQKEMQKFLSTLTEDEQKAYNQIKAKKPARRNAKASNVAVIKVERISSDSSDEASSSKADNKESSSSESESGSDSDSSSESDGSESESDSDSKSEDSGSEKDDSDEESDNAGKQVQRGSGNSSSGESGGSNSGSASESESDEE